MNNPLAYYVNQITEVGAHKSTFHVSSLTFAYQVLQNWCHSSG